MRIIYTEEVRKFILGIYKGKSHKEIATLVNKQFNLNLTEFGISTYLSRNGLRTERAFRYSEEMKEFIKKIHKGKSYQEIKDLFNEKFDVDKTINEIKCFCQDNDMKNGVDCRFQKERIPTNKIPVGTERFRKHYEKTYLYIKIKEPNIWVLKHRYLYEKTYGPIPKNMKLLFLNGDTMDVRIENLKLVSYAEELILNRQKLIFNDPEFTKTGINIAKVILKAADNTRKENSNA
ncbi:HNH endonuclease [Acholeplasma sp. OttesenSCG-928-E16]|nr:HNH endonuclease [Acholeplasma sp. OttesenSCG-928-E16]